MQRRQEDRPPAIFLSFVNFKFLNLWKIKKFSAAKSAVSARSPEPVTHHFFKKYRRVDWIDKNSDSNLNPRASVSLSASLAFSCSLENFIQNFVNFKFLNLWKIKKFSAAKSAVSARGPEPVTHYFFKKFRRVEWIDKKSDSNLNPRASVSLSASLAFSFF